MKKLIAAVLTVFAFSAFANEPWPGSKFGLNKPKYWDSYPAEFTQPFARACMKDKAHLPSETQAAMCVCIVWQIENYISFKRLAQKSDDERVGIMQAANQACAEILSE